jgi:predicted NUDIX family NTP pyrophosphohydrolase
MSPRTPPTSAGILMYRIDAHGVEVLIAHPGGPLWAHRHEGAWSIPKGVIDPGEDPETAARREFAEETGHEVVGTTHDLGEVRLRSGKIVRGFAVCGDLDPESVVSNTFPLEWPPRSGRFVETPEIDRVVWCDPTEAGRLLNPAQVELVDRLVAWLDASSA